MDRCFVDVPVLAPSDASVVEDLSVVFLLVVGSTVAVELLDSTVDLVIIVTLNGLEVVGSAVVNS